MNNQKRHFWERENLSWEDFKKGLLFMGGFNSFDSYLSRIFFQLNGKYQEILFSICGQVPLRRRYKLEQSADDKDMCTSIHLFD